MKRTYRILVVGEDWHGSDCTGLARGFRELGHAVELVGADQYFPKLDESLSNRLLRRAALRVYARQFNDQIVRQLTVIHPEIVLIFKGNHVKPSTLRAITRRGLWLCNFYPDVSFFVHRAVKRGVWLHYNHIFSAKKHGAGEMKSQLGLANVSFLQHGFDPDVHRPIFNQSAIGVNLKCDVSFIGGRSPGKERSLVGLVERLPGIDLKIWGPRWGASKSSVLKPYIQGAPVTGDFYALAISCSKVNLGLLHERVGSAPKGDMVTSRTFHIPASGGFLLHRRTDEVSEYYDEGREITCFDSSEELVKKVSYYLVNDEERIRIARAGHNRCTKENAWAVRAQVIIDKYESELGAQRES